MSAYLHVVLPVTFLVSKKISRGGELEGPEVFLPMEFNESFELASSEMKVNEIKIGDYERTGYTQDVCFQLKNELYNGIKEFIYKFWFTFSALEQDVKYPLLDRVLLKSFIDEYYTKIDFSRDNIDTIDDRLGSIYNNYYIRFYNLLETYVYCGWPFEKSHELSTGMDCFSIMCFSEKLGIERDRENEFYGIVERVKQELKSDYPLSQLLFIVGY